MGSPAPEYVAPVAAPVAAPEREQLDAAMDAPPCGNHGCGCASPAEQAAAAAAQADDETEDAAEDGGCVLCGLSTSNCGCHEDRVPPTADDVAVAEAIMADDDVEDDDAGQCTGCSGCSADGSSPDEPENDAQRLDRLASEADGEGSDND